MGLDRKLHFQSVVLSSEAIAQLEKLLELYPISLTVMGDQTTSKQWKTELVAKFPQLRIITVDERHSSEEARRRYWLNHPAQGLTRLVPQGMRLPPRSVDDIVAVILIERYLNRLVS